ncbi:MAG: undecaprenyl-diphosphate phosphatase [Oscillospiraceae bacterium]|nr:undecaprenyl-diphosphate phosphatase [Oscillospiraceae bacterium]
MALWFAVILGLTQGAAEFLPVSSSGHLGLLQAFFPALAPDAGLSFDVLLHLGTLLSLTLVYRRELWGMMRALLPGSGEEKREGRRLLGLLMLGTLPLGLVLPLRGWIEARCTDAVFIGAALLANGVLLFISDKLLAGRKELRTAGAGDALLVGVLQAFAALPGISRSGSTITAGVLAGLRREDAVRYSFLLSFPAVLGACLVKLSEALRDGFDKALLFPSLAGAAAAALSGLLAIRLVGRLARRGGFRRFSLYCWAVGLAAIILRLIT